MTGLGLVSVAVTAPAALSLKHHKCRRCGAVYQCPPFRCRCGGKKFAGIYG